MTDHLSKIIETKPKFKKPVTRSELNSWLVSEITSLKSQRKEMKSSEIVQVYLDGMIHGYRQVTKLLANAGWEG